MTGGAAAFNGLLAGGALMPLVTGALLAGISGYPVRLPVLGLGLAGALALFLAGLAGREAWAPESGAWPRLGFWPTVTCRRLAGVFLGCAAGLGAALQFGLGTGVMTLPLGALGVLGGYFAFAPPLALGRRGWGEALQALCFGVLPVMAGYYLQSGHLISEILVLGLPLTFVAFNLFLVYGIPAAEREQSAWGLAGRLTPPAVGLIYSVANILVLAGLVFYLLFPANPLPGRPAAWLAVGLALAAQELVKRRAYRRQELLGWWRRLTLALYFTLNLTFLWSVWARLS